MPELKHPTPVYPAGAPNTPPGARVRNFGYDEMDVRIDPYSLQHQTPAGRLAFLNQVMTQILTPLAPLLQQQGIVIDMNAFLAKIAELGDAPDLTEIVKSQPPPQPVDDGSGGPGSDGATQMTHNGPRMPVQTERNYNRTSSTQATEGGQRTARMQQLMAAAKNGQNGKGYA